jgi:hypothetical protein
MNVKLLPKTNYKIKINDNNGILSTNAPVTLRNEKITGTSTVSNLADLVDVVEVFKNEGSSLVYNSEFARYEVKTQDLDGGLF